MPDVFISYNRGDQHRARAIADCLTAEGFEVWWDSNLRAGDSYDEVTEKNLREADAVVVLWSKQSSQSKWVRAEATIGERCSTLVPAMIEECERPLRFELVQTADLIHWHGDRSSPQWRAFVQDIHTATGNTKQPGAAATPTAPAINPESNDTTIENTFWTSIKDGTDRSEFEAYLKRYPDGHFADLARNRVAALERTAASSQLAAAPKPTVKHQPQKAAVDRNTTQAVPQPSRKTAAPQSRQASPPQKQQNNNVLLGLLGLGAVIAGAVFLLTLNRGGTADEPPTEKIVESTPTVDSVPSIPEVAENKTVEETETTETQIATADVPAITDAAPIVDAVPTTNDQEEGVGDTEPDTGTASPVPAAETSTSYTDCDTCPTMKRLAGGSFQMGSPSSERGRYAYEGPQREVIIKPFSIGVDEVTFDQWQACLDDNGCRGHQPRDAGFGRGDRPVLYISWGDANAYVDWLSKRTGKKYRLPTEAEWEYAARGDTATAFWWGDKFDSSLATQGSTKPVSELATNPFGIRGMLSNVSEWVADCYVNNFSKAPTDGSAVLNGDCARRVVRGGDWRSAANDMRSANRGRIDRNIRDRTLGFRVASDLE